MRITNLFILVGFILLSCNTNQVTEVEPEQCTITPQELGVEVSCPNGLNAFVSAGQPGQSNGTGPSASNPPVTLPEVIQLCPGFASRFITSFPELAACINNQLYGIYWDGQVSTLKLLLPGDYKSKVTKAPCSFEIASGCVIMSYEDLNDKKD
jgi:hypothetical protein